MKRLPSKTKGQVTPTTLIEPEATTKTLMERIGALLSDNFGGHVIVDRVQLDLVTAEGTIYLDLQPLERNQAHD